MEKRNDPTTPASTTCNDLIKLLDKHRMTRALQRTKTKSHWIMCDAIAAGTYVGFFTICFSFSVVSKYFFFVKRFATLAYLFLHEI